jgi:hypothetical protein
VEGPLGEIHEPGPGRPHQGYGEVVGHDSLIPACHVDGALIDPQELSGVDHPIVLLWQVGLELGGPDHHTQVWGQGRAPPPPRNSRGARGERCICDLARTHWCMQVKVSLKVVALDVSTPLAVVLEGGVTVLPTSTVIDLLPEVRRLVAGHRRAVLRRRACTWQPREHLHHGRRTRR